MNITEVRARKKLLEAKIAVEVSRLINDFIEETETDIDSIHFNLDKFYIVGRKPKTVVDYCKITINI